MLLNFYDGALLQKWLINYSYKHFLMFDRVLNAFLLLAFNQFQLNVAFHIDISHLFCSAKQLTGFYMKRNTGLKWEILSP